MMKTMIDFMKTMFLLSFATRLWLALLMTLNMAVPLFFISTPEGMATLAAAMAGAMSMSMIFKKQGFVRLLGIGHIYWIPLLLWLLTRFEAASSDSLFQGWILAVIILNSISLVIDGVDVLRYLKGERRPCGKSP